MYTQSGNSRRGTVRAQSGSITFYTLLCFSLAGLITGFAIGGFAGHLSRGSAAGSGSPLSSAPLLTGHLPDPSATVGPENILLGVPGIGTGDYTGTEIADGTTKYRFSAQIINKANNTPITATDVVCRLWLTDNLQATTDALSADNFAIPRNPALFNQPFPQEVVDALNFAAPGQQIQSCAANGKTNWTYTLATSVPEGTYYLAVLADWKGIHYNWSMMAITISSGNNSSD